MSDLFTGKLIRLTAREEDDAKIFAQWSNNPDYLRSMDTDPPVPRSAENFAAWEKDIIGPNSYVFRLRTLEDNTLIGFVALDVTWSNQNAFLAIGIGDPAYWGRGYGADTMRLIMNYAFNELGLHRIGLNVISTNTRAIALYEKMGFKHEGAQREWGQRDGQWFDLVYYGVLRDEWQDLT